jgi:hypothetical protein
MKKLLATTAVAMIAMSGVASAQSVLERVLGQIDNSTNLASVNGTFANIAENIGGSSTVYYDAATNTTLTQAERDALAASPVASDFTVVGAGDAVNNTTGEVITAAAYANLSALDKAAYTVAGENAYFTGPDGLAVTSANVPTETTATLTAKLNALEAVSVGGLGGIDGSITNIVDGITQATQTAVANSDVSAIEFDMPTLNWGDMATTALGAVNTGEITLGVNQAVDEAKTSSTGAYSAVADQLGGSADTGALVLNIASNMTGVNGSIANTMNEVNGTVGDLSTTALGAVNTGTITSGVNAAVTGIIGTSGTGQNSVTGQN